MTKTYQEHEPRSYTNNDGYPCSTYGNDAITRKFKKALELHEGNIQVERMPWQSMDANYDTSVARW